MTFAQCVIECAANDEFVSNWARLRGISFPVTPLEREIDAATFRNDDIARQFISDVADLVWSRIPRLERE